MSCSIQILFIFFCVISKSISLEVLFEDHFNEIDQTKWEIISSENQCKSEFTLLIYKRQIFLKFNSELSAKWLSCPTNRTKNIRIISGSLVLTAIQEPLANHSFTTATVISKESFNLTRSNLIFKVRASFPSAKGVFGVILLTPEEYLYDNSLNQSFVLLVNYDKTIKGGYIRHGDYNTLKPFDISPDLTRFSSFY